MLNRRGKNGEDAEDTFLIMIAILLLFHSMTALGYEPIFLGYVPPTPLAWFLTGFVVSALITGSLVGTH